MKESKIDRFRRVAEARVNKIIKMIRLLGNCSGTSVYAYTDAQVAYIFSALQSELDKAKRRFRKPSLGKHRFSLADTNELFCLEDACLCDAASINLLIADWYRFDSDLRHAMEGMRRYYEKKEAVGNENKAVSDRP